MLKRTRAIVAATVSLIIVAILVSAAFFANQEHPRETPGQYIIVNGNFIVNADSYKAYNFTVPTDISTCQVGGSFGDTTTNSSGIRVLIWDNSAFTNWQQSGHSLQVGFGTISLYDSGLSTNGTIAASPYPGGTYFLIYTNNSTEPQNVTSEADFWYG